MPQLLTPVPLDPCHQSLQCLVLLLPQYGLSLLQLLSNKGIVLLPLVSLHFICLVLDQLCSFVLLDLHQDALSLPQLQEFSRPFEVLILLVQYFVFVVEELLLLLLFELLYGFRGSFFIVGHYVIPRRREFNELLLLSVLDGLDLLVLLILDGNLVSHSLPLPKKLYLYFRSVGFAVQTFPLALPPVLLQVADEVKHSAVYLRVG